MRRISVLFLLLVAGLSLSCQQEPKEVKLTPLSDILEGRVEPGSSVTVQGTVTEATPIPAARRQTYQLSSEAGTSVNVLSEEEPPRIGTRFQVTGQVRTDFSVRGVVLGTVLIEESRSPLVTEDERAPIPLWTWIALGAGVVLILGSVAFLVRRRTRRVEGTCPNCGATTEAGWVVCTECGERLDLPPPAPPPTIVPITPPGPSEEELAEGKRRSAPTVLLPPDDEE